MGVTHGLAGALGGAAVSLLLWLLLTPVRTLLPLGFNVVLAVALAVTMALADLELIGLPRQARQVPQSWYQTYGPYRSHALYGLSLGAALGTNVTYAVEYAVFLAPALLLPLPGALVGGLAFGFARTALVGPLGIIGPIGRRWHAVYAGGRRGLRRAGALLSVMLAAGIVLIWLGLL